jgi:hypothetical protein
MSKDEVTLILPPVTAVGEDNYLPSPENEDEDQGLGEVIKRVMGRTTTVGTDELARQLATLLRDKIPAILSNLRTHRMEGAKLTEVTVCVGISGEGTLGLVTAGVNAGMELTYSIDEGNADS